MTRRAALAAVLAALVAAAVAKPTDVENAGAVGKEGRDLPSKPEFTTEGGLRWWQTGIVYQIYPSSFKDSDGDGIGDLKGIESKLEYLRDIGVTALWLSPIYKSPNKDMGYDISDFKDVSERYGTLSDFQDLVDSAHALGLKVILDFVPNHSSDEHEWFKAAIKDKNSPYHDYYVWNEGIGTGDDRKPPNNWRSVFDDSEDGTAWKYVPSLEKYYLRMFHEGQPDLNYRNPKLVEEMKDVFRFWIHKGVDGFRVDAIPYLFEDEKLRDNPSGTSLYTENLPGTYDMVHQWREVFAVEGERMNKDIVMMLEAYAGLEDTMKYFGTEDQPSSHFPFNFFLISNIRASSTAGDIKTEIERWTENMPYYGWSNWVVGNHDNHRVGSRLNANLRDGYNILVTLLPGTAVTYYGEEIGMLDNDKLTIADCQDPQACPDGANEAYYREHSRDYERTPFHWSAGTNAGFTTGKPWLPIASDYEDLNVENESNDPTSHLSIYKKLAQLRKEHVIQSGDLAVEILADNVLSFTRDNGTHVCLVLINMNSGKQSVDITSVYGNLGELEVYLSTPSFQSTDVTLSNVELPGHASVVLCGPHYKWWQTGIIYQIYPRSFMDKDGDGKGDLKGITSKLPYLKELGVAAVWLSPIYTSPNYDLGYDISDFDAVDPIYGNLEDFEEMVNTAHELGLKVILDFVPNHSSVEHKWFNDIIVNGKDSKFYGYYVWKEGRYDEEVEYCADDDDCDELEHCNEDDNCGPPNSWESVFGGSAWAYAKFTKEYYLHQFHSAQPDLNYNNKEVVQEMKDVLTRWLDRGVDGFRVDAIPHLFEDEDFKDDPDGNNDQYMTNQENTFKMVQEWRKLLDEYGAKNGKDLVMMTEAYANEEMTMKYFGTEDEPGAHFPFNFFLIQEVENGVSAKAVNTAIDKWLKNVPKYGWSNWVSGNHDQHRIGSRLGKDLIDGMNMINLLLPGTAITYQGEEIGMLDNTELTKDDCGDPQACPDLEDDEDSEEYYQRESRDFSRTPFQWSSTLPHAGFTTGTPWLPVPSTFAEINVEVQESDPTSHLSVYKQLVKLRKEPHIQSGGPPTIEILGDNVLAFIRSNKTYATVVLINFGEKEEIVNVVEKYEELSELKEYTSYHFSANTKDLSSISLPSHASIVLGGPVKDLRREKATALKWWQTGIVYQIYPRSFKDSGDDGDGDLQGIISKLQYLKDLGIAAIWLSPIYTSPDKDMGYDIANFTDVHERYGSIDDFDEMVARAHELGLKVVLDFVPNHSSDECKWFTEALKGPDNKYYDYYVWKEPAADGGPPNKWINVFDRGSGWEKVRLGNGKDMYYLHQFHKGQPDLNYNNPVVVQEMKDVISFWIAHGVDGLRVDAIQHLFEDDNFEDGDGVDVEKYQKDQPKTHEMIKQWRELLDRESALRGKDLAMFLEVYADGTTLKKYFGTEYRHEGHFPFNFLILSGIREDSNAADVMAKINEWESNVPGFGWSNWVVGNHDNHRVGSRVGKDLIDAMNMIVTLLPGTAITYNGEELGMVNGDFGIDKCADPQACPEGATDEYYRGKTRDYERTPVQWDGSEYAGFSSKEPWLPVNADYREVNADVESKDSKSHLSIYKKLAYLRKNAAEMTNFKKENLNDNVFSFMRSDADLVYLVVINFGTEEQTVDLKSKYSDLPALREYVSSNFNQETLDLENLKLNGKASVVLVSEDFKDECVGDGCDGDGGDGDGGDGGDGGNGGGDGGGGASSVKALGLLVVSMLLALGLALN